MAKKVNLRKMLTFWGAVIIFLLTIWETIRVMVINGASFDEFLNDWGGYAFLSMGLLSFVITISSLDGIRKKGD